LARPKTIITCAVTGAIHTPTQSDALPVMPDAIAEQAIAAAGAGTAILHLHARHPGVTSREVVWLLPEQLRLEVVPVLHRLQGRLAAEG
jgi:uncharacterized protein (DUF849 family)